MFAPLDFSIPKIASWSPSCLMGWRRPSPCSTISARVKPSTAFMLSWES